MKVFKICGLFIILVSAFVFTYLTTETVDLYGTDYYYCRPIEFWCAKTSWETIIYNVAEDKNERVDYMTYVDITVKDGQFEDEYDGSLVKTNLEDGSYPTVSGYFPTSGDDAPEFLAIDDQHRLVGTALGEA